AKSSVKFGLDRFAVLEEIAGGGIGLIEAAGKVILGENTVFEVQPGRVIVSSDDGQSLDRSRRLLILATEPATIRFTKTMQNAGVLERGQAKPIGTVPEAVGQSELKVGYELLRYITRVEFSDQ